MKHTRKEFAALCGLTPGNLSNYIKTGKVLVVGGKVDDENEQNAYFLSKRQEMKPNAGAEPPKKERKNAMKAIKPAMLDVEKARKQSELLDLEKQQKQAIINQRKQQENLAMLKARKLMGEDIPKSMVKLFFNQHFKSLTMAMKDGMDAMIVEMARKAKLGPNDIAQLRKKMIAMINKAVERASLISERELDNVDEEKMKSAA